MADDATGSSGTADQSTLIVPGRIQEQFPELVALIKASESMNDEERMYWIEMLPVMNPAQQEQLKGILLNEKEQLAAIDAKYGKKIDDMASARRAVDEISEERKHVNEARQSKEDEVRKQEEGAAEDILKEIN